MGHVDLQGAYGVLVAFHLAERRWQVRLDDHPYCRLVKEANLAMVDHDVPAQGLIVLSANASAQHAFLVHSLVGDLPLDGTTLAGYKLVGHVCAVLYDEEAEGCDSLAALVALY